MSSPARHSLAGPQWFEQLGSGPRSGSPLRIDHSSRMPCRASLSRPGGDEFRFGIEQVQQRLALVSSLRSGRRRRAVPGACTPGAGPGAQPAGEQPTRFVTADRAAPLARHMAVTGVYLDG